MGKDTIIPRNANKIVFKIAPIIALVSICIIPVLLPIYNWTFIGGTADIVVIIYLLIIPVVAMIIGGMASGSPFASIGVSREVAAEFTFFLAIPAMFGASLLKLIKFGFHFTGAEFGLLMLGCIVSFGLSVIAIKFLMGYIKQHDFKVFGYYRIVLGGLIIVWTIIQTVIA